MKQVTDKFKNVVSRIMFCIRKSTLIGTTLGFVLGAILPAYGILMLFKSKKAVGDLGEWVGSISTAIALILVVWQVNRTLKSEKEADFRRARPFFVLQIVDTKLRNNDKYYTPIPSHSIKQESFHYDNNLPVIYMNNVSNRLVLAVQVKFVYGKQGSEIICINRISPAEEAGLVNYVANRELINERNPVTSDIAFKDLTRIEICFTTEIREKIELKFSFDGNKMTYLENEKILENKGQSIPINEYDVNNFTETTEYKCHIFEHKITLTEQ